MRSSAGIIKKWLAEPLDVPHELHVVGARLLRANETHGVQYTVDGQQIVLLSTKSDIAMGDFPRDVRVFGLLPNDARYCFDFFEREWSVNRGVRDADKEAEVVTRAINSFSSHSLPFPDRLRRADRGINIGKSACALLAFYDSYVPHRYRYAMPKRIRRPQQLVGSSWPVDDFIIFDHEEDAVSAKMQSTLSYIIDLHGSDEIPPPPLPKSDDDDDYPF